MADAIATELDVAAENVKTKDKLAEDSFVFLGGGLYGPGPSRVGNEDEFYRSAIRGKRDKVDLGCIE